MPCDADLMGCKERKSRPVQRLSCCTLASSAVITAGAADSLTRAHAYRASIVSFANHLAFRPPNPRTAPPPKSLDVRRLSHVARLAAVLVARFGLSLSLLKVMGNNEKLCSGTIFGRMQRQKRPTAHVRYAGASPTGLPCNCPYWWSDGR